MTSRRVTVLSLGGTISMTSDDGAGVRPTLDARDLVDVAAGPPGIEVSTEAFRRVPGGHLTFEDIEALAARIDKLTQTGQSVVVTQGTDTLEEVAFAVDLLIAPDRRAVFTGAMRPPGTPGSDGPANLGAALAVAASSAHLGGVVVVMGDEVHAACLVCKRHAWKPHAFSSPGMGPIGGVVEGRVVMTGVATRLPLAPIQLSSHPREVSVPIIRLGVADDGWHLRHWRSADALVVECYGGGHVPKWLVEDFRDAAAAIPVVMVSRTGDGPLLQGTYGFAGSERDLHGIGALPAASLDALKARVLLSLLLRHGSPEAARDVLRGLAR